MKRCQKHFKCFLMLISLSSFLNPQRAFGFGKLFSVRVAVDESDGDHQKKEKPHSHHHHHGCECSECCDDDDDGFFSQLFTAGITSPWWGPPIALADNSAESGKFLSTPYENSHHGLMDIEPFGQLDSQDVQFRFLADYGSDFSGLTRIGGQFEVDTASRLGFETSWNQFQEDLGTTTDELWLGDANITWRFAQNEAMQFHTGVGLNWLNAATNTDTGFNFTYGFDLFPIKPWVFRGTMDLGRIGDTSRVHFRGDVGLVWKHFEIFTGYNLERISNVNLQGVSAGIQFRF
ncbi:hypothetical protein Pan54_29770 [Rubinisphaera italica]|uniref:Outer membrane protein beta-barrel domain-containing protein n=2 Tax=Rubinisphaera italica TaxID=2527969 RepID=A0A5C5XGG3_9PLAN|nr:hypothetical protein Pan54_29770 [Rubinisphaera italica]